MFHVKQDCARKPRFEIELLLFIGVRGLAHARVARVGSYYWAENALPRAGKATGGVRVRAPGTAPTLTPGCLRRTRGSGR